MLITFCLALLAAKLRHYRPGLLFRSWTIYPLLATECVYLLFQVFTLRGDYRFVPYASLLKTAYMLLFLIPMLVFSTSCMMCSIIAWIKIDYNTE